jgi:tetratricopeptide (TPR) repeat protein
MQHAVVVALVSAALAAPAAFQDHQHGAAGLGTVKFANSCAPDVQPEFARGMALLHSFEFGQARDAFKVVLSRDATCAMALWATGVSYWGNPFAAQNKPPAQMQAGFTALERATAAGARTERERDYIAAATRLFDRYDTVDQRTRARAYRDAMERLAAKYPDDTEAATFYALAIAGAADLADKSYGDLRKAGGILEPLWKTQPDHPGLAHYIIHSYDVPALAPLAVTAARRYAKIAPAATHALHMPSHTFTRLGYWQESIDTNILSAEAARKAGSVYEELHALDYQTYAYLQSGQDAAAGKLVQTSAETGRRVNANAVAGAAPPTAGMYALAAIPARYALERGDWAAASRLEAHASQVAYADALTWFARALGAARMKEVVTAKAAVDELQKAIDRLTTDNEAYWVEQVTIQKLAGSAWVALAEGRQADALAAMREAADREDKTEKAAVTPGPLAPARELLGEMLLELKRPKEALAEFQKAMTKEPNRFRALAGAAAAATQAGDPAGGRKYYEQLLAICVKGDAPGRPELKAARDATRRGSIQIR